jgi:ubiquinone biosynthesis protein UbiJ
VYVAHNLQKLFGFGKTVAQHAARDGLAYTRDEARLFAHAAEVMVWRDEVNTLSLASERLAAKIACL